MDDLDRPLQAVQDVETVAPLVERQAAVVSRRRGTRPALDVGVVRPSASASKTPSRVKSERRDDQGSPVGSRRSGRPRQRERIGRNSSGEPGRAPYGRMWYFSSYGAHLVLFERQRGDPVVGCMRPLHAVGRHSSAAWKRDWFRASASVTNSEPSAGRYPPRQDRAWLRPPVQGRLSRPPACGSGVGTSGRRRRRAASQHSR